MYIYLNDHQMHDFQLDINYFKQVGIQNTTNVKGTEQQQVTERFVRRHSSLLPKV